MCGVFDAEQNLEKIILFFDIPAALDQGEKLDRRSSGGEAGVNEERVQAARSAVCTG